ncbi:MAG: hypothetical protein GX552_00635 [Chloroflexi bacterium]|jgi:hypothetical protein|nr:hypothetical protein [Chloroflexota bacterium]
MEDVPFPISYWVGPPTDLSRYRELADCGVTVAAGPPEALDLVQEVGMRMVVIDQRIHRDLPQEPDWGETVQAVAYDYAMHPALYGYYVTDEPHYRHFEALGQIVRAFQAHDPDHVPFINLFPNYASPDQLGTLDYDTHVRRYLEIVKPPLLSYDHYALMEDGDRPVYFANLETIRREALRAGVPFWNVILATPHFSYRDPSPEDLRWQVYTTLVYGGKGLAYFTYWTLDVENYRNGIIGLYGQRTQKYYTVQQLNWELHRLGPHLMRLTSTGVYHWPNAPLGARVLPGDGLVARIVGDGEYVVGEFVDPEGLPWVMVVNRNRQRSAWTTLYLRTTHTEIQEVSRSSGGLRPIARDQAVEAAGAYADGIIVQFWMAPGDGRLMRLGSRGNGV